MGWRSGNIIGWLMRTTAIRDPIKLSNTAVKTIYREGSPCIQMVEANHEHVVAVTRGCAIEEVVGPSSIKDR